MTADELKRLFPNASAGFLAANTRPAAVVERAVEPRPLAASEEAGAITGRVLIRITSRRSRLIDPRANLYGGTKYLEDACVYAGILHDDKEAFSEGDVRQEKVGKGEEESTVIEIWKL